MRKAIILILSFAIPLSADCSDLITSNMVCHLAKTQSVSSKPKCHQKKESSNEDCECAKTKSKSLAESFKDLKATYRVKLVLDSPLNVLLNFNASVSSRALFTFVPITLSPQSKIPPLRTIHILI